MSVQAKNMKIEISYGDSPKYAMLDHRLVTIERGDDCRCIVTIKKDDEGLETIGVESGLRELAEVINIAAAFYDMERTLPQSLANITTPF
jgi:3-dehydroquinate dehydratase